MNKPKRKKPKFSVGQVVAVKGIKGVCQWAQITEMFTKLIELDEIPHVLYKHSELRPLTNRERGQ